MTDYEQLVEALRSDAGNQYTSDAADAIEALQAEEKSRNENCEKCADATRRVIVDLQGIIADLRAQLPKRGEWIHVQEVDVPGEMHPVALRCICSTCRNEYVFPRIPQYCPDCGSWNTEKMEVRDGK